METYSYDIPCLGLLTMLLSNLLANRTCSRILIVQCWIWDRKLYAFKIFPSLREKWYEAFLCQTFLAGYSISGKRPVLRANTLVTIRIHDKVHRTDLDYSSLDQVASSVQ